MNTVRVYGLIRFMKYSSAVMHPLLKNTCPHLHEFPLKKCCGQCDGPAFSDLRFMTSTLPMIFSVDLGIFLFFYSPSLTFPSLGNSLFNPLLQGVHLDFDFIKEEKRKRKRNALEKKGCENDERTEILLANHFYSSHGLVSTISIDSTH